MLLIVSLFAVVATNAAGLGLPPLTLPFTFDVGAITEHLMPMAETMFNLLMPVLGLIAGITLGVGLVGKVLSAIRSAF
jgi:hypothetical protein